MSAEWAMVIITAVYVAATILICYYNYQSAKASKEQLSEMKKQYNEENRPNLEVEFIYERRSWYGLRFINHGKRTAQDVHIQFDQKFIDSLPEESFRLLLTKQKDKKCIIGVGQHYDLFIGGSKLLRCPNMIPVTGVITYQSNGEIYSSDISVDLENYMTFFSVNNDHDDLIKQLQGLAHELNRIVASVEKISNNDDF